MTADYTHSMKIYDLLKNDLLKKALKSTGLHLRRSAISQKEVIM